MIYLWLCIFVMHICLCIEMTDVRIYKKQLEHIQPVLTCFSCFHNLKFFEICWKVISFQWSSFMLLLLIYQYYFHCYYDCRCRRYFCMDWWFSNLLFFSQFRFYIIELSLVLQEKVISTLRMKAKFFRSNLKRLIRLIKYE